MVNEFLERQELEVESSFGKMGLYCLVDVGAFKDTLDNQHKKECG